MKAQRSFIGLILLVAGIFPADAQRLFTLKTDSLTRSYLLWEAIRDAGATKPLVILLHDRTTTPMTLVQLDWSVLRAPSLLVFPVGLRGLWASGGHADSLKADENFLLRIILRAQHDFKTDASRVFIVGMGGAFYFARFFAQKHPALVRAAFQWNRSVPVGNALAGAARQLDSLVAGNPGRKQPVAEGTLSSMEAAEQKRLDSAGRWRRHAMLLVHLGRWQQAAGSRTDFDTKTLTDLAKYHFMFGLMVGYSFTEKWSAFVEGDFLIIPKERTINNVSGGGGQSIKVNASGKGGVVIPYGAGIRYTILVRSIRPFVSGSIGSTFLFIGGGTASGGPGSIDKTIYKRKESILRYASAAGVDLPVSRITSIQISAQYTFSPKIEPPLASVDRFQGFNLFFGLLFNLGKHEGDL
jgi:hypothetical protein